MRRPNVAHLGGVPQLARARAGVEREPARIEPGGARTRSAAVAAKAATAAGSSTIERVVEVQQQRARSCPVDVEAHGVALRQARAGRGILVDDLPSALVERCRRGRRPARRP